MRLREIGRWTLSRWLAVGTGVVIVAFVVGFAFGQPDSEGVLAQDATLTPTPTSTPTPTAEFDTMTATNPGILEIPIVVIDPQTGRPAEDRPATAHQRVPRSQAEAEYLTSDPERTIYLEGADRVIHLPDGIVIRWIYRDGYFSRECTPGHLSSRCPVEPAYHLRRVANRKLVGVDSAGYVFVTDSDTLPEGFEFLSGFEVITVDANIDK